MNRSWRFFDDPGRHLEKSTMRQRNGAAKAWDMWADTMRSGVATWTVLAVRVPQLMTGTMTPKESTRMVDEKRAAARDGVLAASKTALRGPRGASIVAVLRHSIDVMEAAARPAQKTVGANAKRLTRPRRSRAKQDAS